jgi:hypothetical protein
LLQCLCVLWMIGFGWYFFSLHLPNVPASLVAADAEGEVVVSRMAVWRALHPSLTSLPNPLDFDTSHAEGVESGLDYLGPRIGYWVWSGLLFGVAWVLGAGCVAWLLSGMTLYRSERFVVQAGVGLSLFSLWILVAGRMGLLSPGWLLGPPLVTAMLAGCVTFALKRTGDGSSVAVGELCAGQSSRRAIWTAIAVLFPFAVMLLLGSMTPPWDFDVREYHMQGPKEWFVAGEISFLEHNVYTSFPFLSEMLSLAAMVVRGDWRDGAICGKVLLGSFQFLTAVAVYAVGRRWFSQTAGLLATIVYLTTPWTFRISIIAYAEGAAGFYLMAASMVYLLVPVCEDRSRWRLIGLSGFLAGSAMAAKYPGVLSVVIPVGLILLVTVIRTRTRLESVSGQSEPAAEQWSASKQVAGLALIYALGVVVAVGPWLVRNVIDTGNPVYPLLYSVFGGVDLTPEMDLKWKRGHSPDDHDLTEIPRYLTDIAARSDWTSGLLFGLSIPALLWLRRHFAVRALWFMAAWMLVTWWGLTHRIDRFWVPIIPVFAVLAGAAWGLFAGRTWRVAVLVLVSVCTVFNLSFWKVPRLTGFQIGLLDMQAARQLTVRTDFKRLNLTLPDDARVLMVGEAEVFDAEFDVVYNTVFDRSLFESWTRSESTSDAADSVAMKPAAEIAETLRREGITHIVVNWSEILRYRRPGSYGYTSYVQPDRFDELVRAGVLHRPTLLMSGDWMALGKADRQEILSWVGGAGLVDGDVWRSGLSYRVTGGPVD